MNSIQGALEILRDPVQLKAMVAFFIAPLGALVLSWLIQKSVTEKVGAGLDLFVFLIALDLSFLVDPAGYRGRLGNERFSPVFVAFLIWSVVWTLIAARVERRVQQSLGAVTGPLGTSTGSRSYPHMRVALCWFVALISIAVHLYLTLGGKKNG